MVTIRTMDCVECGESVAYGRLSCPSCGALLASVAGARRPAGRIEAVAPAPAPDLEPAPRMAAPGTAVATAEREPSRPIIGRPYSRHLAPDPDEEAESAPPPSAYRPSALTLATAGTAVASPSSGSVEAGAAAAGQTPSDAAALTRAPLTRRFVLDVARFNEIAGWFVIVGATMSVLGLLLPWSTIVIGSGGFGGYFDTWGLAGPAHPLVFLGLLGILALAVLRTAVPAWIWSTAVSIGLGGVLVGLAWPYLFGPLGAQVGVAVTVLGAVALLIGGAVATWAARHEATDSLV